MNEPQRNLINFIISPEERAWLDRLVDLDGGGGKSAYLRRLIRREATRAGLTSQVPWAEPTEPTEPDEAVPA
jgi:hypothetical protein